MTFTSAARGTEKEMVEQSFANDVVRCTAKLRAYARRLVGRQALVDDLVQETVLRALIHVDQFKPGTNLQAWLSTILRHSYFNELRQARRYTALNNDPCPESDVPVGGDQMWRIEVNEINKHFAALPAAQQQAISLVAVEGNSYETAALKAGCACGTMKSRVSRARATLAEAIEAGNDSSNSPSQETRFQNDLKHFDDAA